MKNVPPENHPGNADTPLPKPNWNKWRFIVEALPHDVVALSCDISPEALREGIDGDLLEEFFRREDIIHSHIQSGVIQLCPRNVGTNVCNFLNLADFATWASGLGWELPPEFPRRTPGLRPSAPSPR